MPRPTIKRVKELLSYNPETGELRWRVDRHGGPGNKPLPAGSVAGTISRATGYVFVNIDHMPQGAHRIAWAITHGRWPSHQMDHINMIRTDNRLRNLREATNAQNGANRKAQSNNKSTGVKGVCKISWMTSSGLSVGYCATLNKKHIGLFKTIEDARAARNKAALGLHKDFFRKS